MKATFTVVAFLALFASTGLASRSLTQEGGDPSLVYADVTEAARAAKTTTFLEAVELAGLTDALANASAVLTVFVPNNDAFSDALEELGFSDLQGLQDQGLLAPILENHVVEGALTAAELVEAGEVLTLLGQTLTISDEGKITSSGGAEAEVETANASAGQSIVHIISAVLTPRSAQAPAPSDGSASEVSGNS